MWLVSGCARRCCFRRITRDSSIAILWKRCCARSLLAQPFQISHGVSHQRWRLSGQSVGWWHYRPISARLPAQAKVVFGSAPMTLYVALGRPECKGPPRRLPYWLSRPSLANVRQFRMNKEYCSESLPVGASLTTLAGNLRQTGSWHAWWASTE